MHPVDFLEYTQETAENHLQPRYAEYLTDLMLNNPQSVSTSDEELARYKLGSLVKEKDPVNYDRVEDGNHVNGQDARGPQLQLVRLLGAEIRSRQSDLTPKDLYRSLHGLCLMRYKHDKVMRTLVQSLRLPKYFKKLTGVVRHTIAVLKLTDF